MVYRDSSWTMNHGTCMIIHGMILVFDIIVGGISSKVSLAEYQGNRVPRNKYDNSEILQSKVKN